MKQLLHHLLKSYLRHFPLGRGKTRLFSALWKPLSFGEYHREATLLQADLKLHCDLTKFLQRHHYFFGAYEKEYCDYWIKLAPHAAVIFDIGANVGLYSLRGAKNLLESQAVGCIFLELVEPHANRAGHSTVAIKLHGVVYNEDFTRN